MAKRVMLQYVRYYHESDQMFWNEKHELPLRFKQSPGNEYPTHVTSLEAVDDVIINILSLRVLIISIPFAHSGVIELCGGTV